MKKWLILFFIVTIPLVLGFNLIENCAPGSCNLENNYWCNNGVWENTNYCGHCGLFDSDCIGNCEEDACDYDANLWCYDNEWINDYYCDISICGTEIDPNAYCDYTATHPTEISCTDEFDNDGDGSFDCFDDDCSCECVHDTPETCGIDEGECQQGERTCLFGNWSSCVGGVEPIIELCDDNKDNDCDGEIDEDDCKCIPGSVRVCGSGEGVCATGIQQCNSNGQWGICYGSGYITPTEEILDGKDNDCDGLIDEDFTCVEGSNQSCGSDIGICSFGKQICVNGEWGECIGGINPWPNETCNNNLDDDCDGFVDDEDDECQEGEIVVSGNVTIPSLDEDCEFDEDCNEGFSCEEGKCKIVFVTQEPIVSEPVVKPQVEESKVNWWFVLIPLVVIFAVLGFLGWYFFLRKEEKAAKKVSKDEPKMKDQKPFFISKTKEGQSREEKELQKSLKESKDLFKK